MEIYINDMEMPIICTNCKLFGLYGCKFIGSESCHLIPVQPHEDLIEHEEEGDT